MLAATSSSRVNARGRTTRSAVVRPPRQEDTAVSSSPPPRSTQTRSRADTRTSVTHGSGSNDSSGPLPTSSDRNRSAAAVPRPAIPQPCPHRPPRTLWEPPTGPTGRPSDAKVEPVQVLQGHYDQGILEINECPLALHPWNRPRMHGFTGHLALDQCLPLSSHFHTPWRQQHRVQITHEPTLSAEQAQEPGKSAS